MLDWETVGYHNHISCWRYNLTLTSEHLPQGSWIASCLCIREVNFEVCFDSYLQFLTTVKRMASTLNKTALLLKQPERQVCVVLTFSTVVLFEEKNFIIIIIYVIVWMAEWLLLLSLKEEIELKGSFFLHMAWMPFAYIFHILPISLSWIIVIGINSQFW